MAIVCGTDFSPASASTADVAAQLAARLRLELVLVHVLHVEPGYASVKNALRDAMASALQREAARLGASGAKVRGRMLEGSPEEAIARFSREERAEVVIVSALGTRSGTGWQLGASAERIAQRCEVPVLVLRDPEPFLLWLGGRRPLRAVVAVDRTNTSKDAIAFLGRLRAAAPIDVTAVHVYWAFDELRRLGLYGVRSWVDPDPRVEEVLRREVREELGELPGNGSVDVELALTLGRAADRILEVADRDRADLVVSGSHRRNLADRLWNGSTSRRVLQDAHASVAVVTGARRALPETRPIGSVLVATDFSPTADEAVRMAYRMVAPGGVVHLIHVREPPPATVTVAPRDIFDRPSMGVSSEAHDELLRALRERTPAMAQPMNIRTDARVVWASPPADGVLQASRRLGVDVLVLGTRGRSAVTMAVLGSVAQEVAARSEVPVLLVHPPPK